MDNNISPKYQMQLIANIEAALWAQYSSYKNVKFYLEKWIVGDMNWQNFSIYNNSKGDIDLLKTLHGVPGETLLKMAIDLGVETPDFIPSIPTFRNEIKSDYQTAHSTFEKAFKEIEEHPDIALGLANSALESILKEILKDEQIEIKSTGTKTLYELTSDLLKVFRLFPESEMPMEIKTIGSSLLSVSQSIEKLRSEKTTFHGKTGEDYMIQDPLYTYFVVNSITTVGLFLISYYKQKFPKPIVEDITEDELPF
jgi:hypothetical protein